MIITAMAISASPVLAGSAMPQTIYEDKTSDNIASGVAHEKILRFTTVGWLNLNVLRIDMENEYTDIKGLTNPKGIPNRDKVSSMVEKSDAIAGINGDYFNFAPLPSSMGTLINDGEVISSPIEKAYGLPTFFIDILNQADIGYMDRHSTAKNLRSGQVITINTINKVTKDFDTVTMLNKHWSSKSIGNRFNRDLVEVVVENDVVKDIRVGQPATNIPENGYVLAARGERVQGMNKFRVGDKIRLHVETTPNNKDIKFAIGGGSIILKDGTPTITDIHSKGNHPRTGIGISHNGKELILVTVDGRSATFKGVGQKQFGAILKDLGAYNGLNLDGGGSTTMAIKDKEAKKTEVVNKPSEGVERSVVNGVGIFSDAPIGELSYLKISTDDSNMFVDTSRTFKVKGFDEHHNQLEIDESEIEFTHKGTEGTMGENKFKATSSGKATITASLGDVTGSKDVEVLGRIKHISSDLSQFHVDISSGKRLPDFTARDANGYTAKVDPMDMVYSATNQIGSVSGRVFNSGKNSTAGGLTAKLGDGVFNMLVTVGSEGTLVEEFNNLDNFKFSSYPESVTGDISLNEDHKEGSNSLSLKYDFSKTKADTKAAYVNFKNNDSGLTLEGEPKKLGLWVKGDNKNSWLRGTIKDSKGNSSTIDFVENIVFEDWQYVITDLPANMSYPITLERIYVVDINPEKKYSGEILIDGLKASYPPNTGDIELPNEESLKDEKNTTTDIVEDGFSIGLTMEPKGLNDLVGYDATSEIKEKLNNHKMAIFLGGSSAEFQKGITTKSRINANSVYSRNRYNDVSFINVNTSKKGISSTNPDQWARLKDDLVSINTNNLIVTLSSPIDGPEGFSDEMEAKVLRELLENVSAERKDVFVIHVEDSATTDLKNGVRYIGLNTNKLNKAEDINNLSIVEFIVNGSDVTYEINPLFPKQ